MTTTLQPPRTARRRPAPDPIAAVRAHSTSSGLAAQAAAARARRSTGTGPHKTRRDAAAPPPAASRRRVPPEGRAPVRIPSAPSARSAPSAPAEGAGARRAGSAAVAAAVRAPVRLVEEARHLRLVEPAKRARGNRARAGWLLGVAFSFCVVAVFGLVALHVVSAEKQFQIDRLTASEQRVQATYEQLRLQVDQLDTPQHILSEAHRLGLVQPTSVTFLHGGPPASSGGAPPGAADWTKMKAVLAGTP